MARPLRLEFSGALYHLTARGNARGEIFLDDEDRLLFLELFGKEITQQGRRCYTYCLMNGLKGARLELQNIEPGPFD